MSGYSEIYTNLNSQMTSCSSMIVHVHVVSLCVESTILDGPCTERLSESLKQLPHILYYTTCISPTIHDCYMYLGKGYE